MNTTDQQIRIKRIQEQRAQLLAQQNRLLGRQRAEINKADKRKRFLIGELVLEHAQQFPKTQEWLHDLLQKNVRRNKDRALFGLPALPEKNEERREGGGGGGNSV